MSHSANNPAPNAPDEIPSSSEPHNDSPPDLMRAAVPSFDAVRALFVVFHAAQSFEVMRALQGTSRQAPLRRRDLNDKLPLASERAILNALGALKDAGLVRREPVAEGIGAHYFLSEAGHEILPLLENIGTTCEQFSSVLLRSASTQRANRRA